MSRTAFAVLGIATDFAVVTDVLPVELQAASNSSVKTHADRENVAPKLEMIIPLAQVMPQTMLRSPQIYRPMPMTAVCQPGCGDAIWRCGVWPSDKDQSGNAGMNRRPNS
jgi:hypothetical protein